MVEKELMDLIQIFSQIASATGVCFAAYYYITTLKNAEREKRKQTILQKLPTTMSKEFGDSYYFLNSKESVGFENADLHKKEGDSAWIY